MNDVAFWALERLFDSHFISFDFIEHDEAFLDLGDLDETLAASSAEAVAAWQRHQEDPLAKAVRAVTDRVSGFGILQYLYHISELLLLSDFTELLVLLL